MAITKIHPIKTTLNISIDYICDASKTDEQILISTSDTCGYKTAYLDFELTRKQFDSKSKNLARHLIQSFSPEDNLTPAQAHEIGEKLIKEHLQNRYEYVLSTHIDKGHLHNHIIFNNVNFVDGKAYNSNKRSYHQIRNISDRLCKEYGLSIINEKNKTKGGSYKEYIERKSGNSYKANLKYSIDRAIKKSRSWEEFLKNMKLAGYEIKTGKYISFKSKEQQRFTRAKTIGDDYSKDRIKIRIISRSNIKSVSAVKSRTRVVDLNSNKLADESEGFARWLKLQNLKNAAKTFSEISSGSANNIHEFYKSVDDAYDELGEIQSDIKKIENKIILTSKKIKNINIYKKYRGIYDKYQNTKYKDKFFRNYESEIIIFESARESLKKPITKELILSIPKLKNELGDMSKELGRLTNKLKQQQIKVKDVYELKENLDIYLKSNDINKNVNRKGR